MKKSHGYRSLGAPANQRVRSCLRCEAIIPFDQDPCGQCGAPLEGTGVDSDRVKLCLQCQELQPFHHVYCIECGAFTLEVGETEVPVAGNLEESGQSRGRLPETVGFVLLGLGMLALCVAVWGLWVGLPTT